MSVTPPGWYPDGSGSNRYWDGASWTEHTTPAEVPSLVASPATMQAEPDALPSAQANLAASATAADAPQDAGRGAPRLGALRVGGLVGTILALAASVLVLYQDLSPSIVPGLVGVGATLIGLVAHTFRWRIVAVVMLLTAAAALAYVASMALDVLAGGANGNRAHHVISYSTDNLAGIVLGIVGAILGIVSSATMSRARNRQEKARREVARAQKLHDSRVAQVAQWEAVHREVHGGQAPPPGLLPPSAAMGLDSTRTNVAAILALVFGFGGGLLGIVFGHVALTQIAETGERGRGMAVAGLVLGYLGLLAVVVLVVVFLVLAD